MGRDGACIGVWGAEVVVGLWWLTWPVGVGVGVGVGVAGEATGEAVADGELALADADTAEGDTVVVMDMGAVDVVDVAAEC